MDQIDDYFLETKALIDEKLRGYMVLDERLLNGLQQSIDYTLYSGGKRVRPLFCFTVGDLFHVPKEKLIAPACALEMIHTSSLIMDDLPLMDDAKVRRGKPANHLAYGQGVSALASLGLLTKAYEIILKDPVLQSNQKQAVVLRLLEAVGLDGMVGGQFVDLKYAHKDINLKTLQYIHLHKTASLFIAAGEIAGIIGNVPENEIHAIASFARHLGFAFQILDDILDYSGNPEGAEKTAQKNSANVVNLVGMDKAKTLLEAYSQNAIKAMDIFQWKNEKLLAFGQVVHKKLLRHD